MKQETVSVIIPAYNAGRYIGEALQSVLDQTIIPSEIIVIDDGSTDETERVVAAFDTIRYYKQFNQGTAKALNHGIEKSTGDILMFLDADDVCMPSRIALQLKAFSESPTTDMVFGGMVQFISPDLPDDEKEKIDFNPEPMVGIHKSSWAIKRSSFLKVGFFKGTFALEEFVDWYVLSKEMNLKEMILTDILARRRIHSTNSMRVNKDLRLGYPKILKAALDRRRQTS